MVNDPRPPRPQPEPARVPAAVRRLESAFEAALWSSRLLVLVPVAASLALALAAVVIGVLDVAYLAAQVGQLVDPALSGEPRADLRAAAITSMIKAVDAFLLGAILLIFSFGIYELFVNRIDPAERSSGASRLLLIHTLDDLKDRLAKVVLLVLVIRFFQQALSLDFASPLELLYLGGGILFVGVALYLTSRHPHTDA